MQWQREDGAGEYLPRAILAFNRPWSDIWPWNGRGQIWERPLLSFYCTVCWSVCGILVCTLYDYEQLIICTSVISIWIESGKRGWEVFLGELPESTFVVGITVLYSSLHDSTEPLLYIYLSTLLLISPALHKRRGAIGLHEHLQSPILALIWNFQYLSEWNPNPINKKLFIIQYLYSIDIFFTFSF